MRKVTMTLVAVLLTGWLAAQSSPVTVETVAIGHRFEMSTQEVPSGWTTFTLENRGDEVHFLVIEKFPEGKTLQDSVREILPKFQEGMDLINAGDAGAGFAKIGELPAWFGEVQYMGGPGLVSPGRTAEVTVHLPAGTYVVECYVKDENGEFHSYHGMIEQLIVTEEESGAAEPVADQEIRLNNQGIVASESIAEGEHLFAVHFDEHQPPPAFGNDVHLVRLDANSDEEAIAAWMDWSAVQGLRSPAPAEFLGGVHEMPVGNVAYLRANLEPGRYALASELSPSFGMWTEFEVFEAD